MPILGVLLASNDFESFTSLFYFWKTSVLKKKLTFYLYFEKRLNLALLQRVHFRGVIDIWSQWKFYVPILLLKNERFKKKINVLSQFWKNSEFRLKSSCFYCVALRPHIFPKIKLWNKKYEVNRTND